MCVRNLPCNRRTSAKSPALSSSSHCCCLATKTSNWCHRRSSDQKESVVWQRIGDTPRATSTAGSIKVRYITSVPRLVPIASGTVPPAHTIECRSPMLHGVATVGVLFHMCVNQHKLLRTFVRAFTSAPLAYVFAALSSMPQLMLGQYCLQSSTQQAAMARLPTTNAFAESCFTLRDTGGFHAVSVNRYSTTGKETSVAARITRGTVHAIQCTNICLMMKSRTRRMRTTDEIHLTCRSHPSLLSSIRDCATANSPISNSIKHLSIYGCIGCGVYNWP